MKLDEKAAIITGGGRGIGAAICLALANKGADIAVADMDFPSAEAVAQQVRSLGRKGTAIQTDVSDSKEVEKMVDSTLQEFGKIDILVNNAGILKPPSLIVDLKEEDWDQVIDINAKGVFLCCKIVARHMIDRKQGRIINIASRAAKIGEQYNCAYCASKAAVIAITQTLALELAPYRINVNAICPGMIGTKLMEVGIAERASLFGLSPEAIQENLIEEIPLGRVGEPMDVAKVVLVLVSEYTDYMTGQAINVTGGLIFH